MKKMLLKFTSVVLLLATFGVNQAGATTCAQATVISSLPYSAQVQCSGTNDITWAGITQCDLQGTTSDANYYSGNEAVLVYTASSTQTMNVGVVGQTWTSITVYIGCPTSGGTCVGGIASTGGTKTLTGVQFNQGQTYYIVVDSWATPHPCDATGTVITIAPPPPPPANEECATATELIPNPTCILTNGSNVNSTQSLASITCGGFTSSTANDVWYQFTATEANHVVRVNGGTTLDVIVDVRSGSCNGTNLACADAQVLSGAAEVVSLTGLTVGSVYYVRVYGWAGATGAFTICLEGLAPPPPPIPANDECSGAIAISCGLTTSGSTISATADAPTICGPAVTAPGVWYTIEGDGDVFNLTACSMGFDPYLSVYTGTCGTFECVAGDNNACSEVEFLSTPGTTYYILVHGDGANTGNFSLEATCVPLCPAPIGAPWTVTSINGAAGAALENCDGTFSVTTTGAGTATADKIQFIHQTLTGNGYVQAEITAFTKFTLGGVQFRDGVAAGAKKVAIATQLGSRVTSEIRTVTGGSHSARQLSAPKNSFVRISRVGDVFTSYVSGDGVNWNQINQVTVAGLPSTLEAGFFVNSQLAGEGSVDFNSATVSSGLPLREETSNRNLTSDQTLTCVAYPNPARTELNINMVHLAGTSVEINVMNSLGQVVLHQNFNNASEVERLDINKLNSGVYFLQVNDEAIQKFVVKK